MMQEFSWQVRERMREREVGEGRWREKGRERGPEKVFFQSYHHLGSYESSGWKSNSFVLQENSI